MYMSEISVRDFKAKLSHYLDAMSQGEVFTVRGLDIGCVTTPVTTPSSVTTCVTTLSDKDITRIAERFATLVVGQKISNSAETVAESRSNLAFVPVTESTLTEARVADHGVVPEPENTREVQYVMIERWRVDENCFGDEMKAWIKWPANNVAKGVPTRPYVEEESVALPKYDLGVTMKPRAKMNDGSKPDPKPVSKKKK
jgi:hypothetical protein